MSFAALLGLIPDTLRDELIDTYTQIENNFRERRWEPSELNGRKLCEVVYSILKGYIEGAFPSHSYKPSNMLDACRTLEKSPAAFSRSLRIQIPRMMVALYEVRNNRGVGHVGGDVDPNEMDANCVLQLSKWIVCELVRVFHSTTTEKAEAAVSALTERELSLIWVVDGVSRVLDTKLSMSDKTLVLLYAAADGRSESDLLRSVEHSNASIYRRDILRKLHKRRHAEFNENTGVVKISPLGSSYVEQKILRAKVE
jgi:hypothetical protein